MKVELVYDHDCPNVSEARTNLLLAFGAAQIPAEWTEWEKNSPDSPDYVGGYGSPTILVNGKDVDGVNPVDGISSCRIYRSDSGGVQKAPSVETIASALQSAGGRHSAWRGFFATLPGGRICHSSRGWVSGMLARIRRPVRFFRLGLSTRNRLSVAVDRRLPGSNFIRIGISRGCSARVLASGSRLYRFYYDSRFQIRGCF